MTNRALKVGPGGMRTFRVDDEVYAHIIKAKAMLELATTGNVSIADAVAFLQAVGHHGD